MAREINHDFVAQQAEVTVAEFYQWIERREMRMFQYTLANQSEAVQCWYERELARLMEWAWRRKWSGFPLAEALEVIEEAVRQCSPLSWRQYHNVCGSAALLAYVAREADEGFERLREFFQGVPGLFQIEWSCLQEPEAVVSYGYGE